MTENTAVTEEDLAGLQDTYEGAAVATGTGGGLPDNDYLVKIIDMFVGKSKAGKIQVVTDFEVIDGDMLGKSTRKFDGLTLEENVSYFKQYCEILGIVYPSDITKLPEVLSDFVSGFADYVKITIKTKGEFTNTYVNGVVTNEDILADPGA